VIESDHPFKLLAENINDNKITNTTGVFADMVLFTGF